MSRLRRHMMTVEIQCETAQGSHDAEKRLMRWIDSVSHTTAKHGFEVFKVGRIAGKAMKGRRSAANEGEP